MDFTLKIRENGAQQEVFDPVRQKWVVMTPEVHLYEQAGSGVGTAGPEHLQYRVQIQQHGPGPGQGRAVLRGADHLLHYPGLL